MIGVLRIIRYLYHWPHAENMTQKRKWNGIVRWTLECLTCSLQSKERSGCQVQMYIPQAVLYHAVLAGPPTGTCMVALKDQGRLLPAELRQQTASLQGQKGEGKCRNAQNFGSASLLVEGSTGERVPSVKLVPPNLYLLDLNHKYINSSLWFKEWWVLICWDFDITGLLGKSGSPRVLLTLSYQQRRLSCPHMHTLDEQSSLHTQYCGGKKMAALYFLLIILLK